MKKWLIVLLAILLLLIAGVYLLIPGESRVEVVKNVKANPQGTLRTLQDPKDWKKWWPNTSDSDSLVLNQSAFTLKRPGFQYFELTIHHEDALATSVLRIIPVGIQSTRVEWTAFLAGGNNPLERWKSYRASRAIQKNLETLSDSLQHFLEKPTSIYGMDITQERVVDTILVSTTGTFPNEPTTAEVYTLINKLRQHVTSQQATITNPPMVNISKTPSGFGVMAALPVNRRLPTTKNIDMKIMIAGKILVGEVKGGPHTVKSAFRQMEYYLSDHGRVPPAIPFYSFVTDRSMVADSSQWITRIYYPVL